MLIYAILVLDTSLSLLRSLSQNVGFVPVYSEAHSGRPDRNADQLPLK